MKNYKVTLTHSNDKIILQMDETKFEFDPDDAILYEIEIAYDGLGTCTLRKATWAAVADKLQFVSHVTNRAICLYRSEQQGVGDYGY